MKTEKREYKCQLILNIKEKKSTYPRHDYFGHIVQEYIHITEMITCFVFWSCSNYVKSNADRLVFWNDYNSTQITLIEKNQ